MSQTDTLALFVDLLGAMKGAHGDYNRNSVDHHLFGARPRDLSCEDVKKSKN